MKAPKIDIHCTGANDSSRVLIKHERSAEKERKFEESVIEVSNNGVSPLIIFIVPAFTFCDLDADLNMHKIEFVPTNYSELSRRYRYF